MDDFGPQLVEILPLRHMQGLGDAMKDPVLRRISSQSGGGGFPVGIDALPASTIALRPEAAEPDAGLLKGVAPDAAGGAGLEADAEDFRDALEILVDGVIPVMIKTALAMPGTGLVPGALGEFFDLIDSGRDHLGHALAPHRFSPTDCRGEFRERGRSGGLGVIDHTLGEVAPERVDKTALQRAGTVEHRTGRGRIADIRRGAAFGPQSASLTDHALCLRVAVDRDAPADAAHLHFARKHEAMFRIEDGDALRHLTQVCIAASDNQARRDSGGGLGHGTREITASAEIDVALKAQMFECQIVPICEAPATDPQGQAGREAQMGEGFAEQNFTLRAEGGSGEREIHRDYSAKGGRRLSPTLKPVTNPPARLSLWRLHDQNRAPAIWGITPLPCPAGR